MYLADVAAPRFRNQDRIPFRLNLGVLHLVSAVVPAPAVLSERVGPVLAGWEKEGSGARRGWVRVEDTSRQTY